MFSRVLILCKEFHGLQMINLGKIDLRERILLKILMLLAKRLIHYEFGSVTEHIANTHLLLVLFNLLTLLNKILELLCKKTRVCFKFHWLWLRKYRSCEVKSFNFFCAR